MKTNPNDTAYPFVAGDQTNFDDRVLSEGLTKREYFAAIAMQTFCKDDDAKACDEPTEKFYTMVALASVRMADALITELNKAK